MAQILSHDPTTGAVSTPRGIGLFGQDDGPHDLTWLSQQQGGPSVTVSRSPSAVGNDHSPTCWALPRGLAHPHIHLDKCYLLGKDANIEDGSFEEAMKETSRLKSGFTKTDLVQRGRRLLEESLLSGVTVARCHVEVDPTVGLLCLEAGLELQREFAGRLDVRLAVFAQDQIHDGRAQRRQDMWDLLQAASKKPGVSCIGSAPYVEADRESEKANIDCIYALAEESQLDVDFHCDYNLQAWRPNDPNSSEPAVFYVLDAWRERTGEADTAGSHSARWSVNGRPARLALGHCTRISTFDDDQLDRLTKAASGLDVTFIGLPTSDLYMQGRDQPWSQRSRATLNLPRLSDRGLRCCVDVNNIANLFTPQGSPDPLSLLPMLVGLWQEATPEQLSKMLGFVTDHAHHVVGTDDDGGAADSPWLSCVIVTELHSWSDIVLNPPHNRLTIKNGRLVATRVVQQTLH